ncbi:MAG: hypothetical protein ACP5OA_07275 [Candidatus Woesearchaeota archaeon]
MEDKTPLYLMSIVGIVALVAVVVILSSPNNSNYVDADYGNAITGNAVYNDTAPINRGGFGRFLVGIGLLGGCLYLYKLNE